MSNETLITELDVLNEKRTQGDWVYHVDKYRVKIESNFIPDQEVICLTDCGDKAAGNGIFIAKAPEMYQLIKQQQAEIKALMGNIDNWVEYSETVEAEITRLRAGLEDAREILNIYREAIDYYESGDKSYWDDTAEKVDNLLNPQEKEEI